jgi:hypothetical protein
MATEPVTKIERTPIPTDEPSMREIRGAIWETVLLLRDEQKSPASANAEMNAIGKYLSTIRLEMDYNQRAGRKVVIPLLESGATNGELVDGHEA